MNGRVYDYNLGRFLSVDPFIHGNGNSQGINPYSYIMNNPLSGTDPSGYSPEKETVEITEDTQAFQDGDGNKYVSAGDGSGDLIKVETVTVTKSNGSTSSFNVSSAGATTEIGSQGSIAQNRADNNNSSQSFDNGLNGEIQSQAQNMAKGIGRDFGYEDDSGSVTAKLGDIQQDENGIVTQASVLCGRSCQSQAGLYTYEHSLALIRQRNMEDPTMMALRVMHGYSDRLTNNKATAWLSYTPNPLAQEIASGIALYRLLVHQDIGAYGGAVTSGMASDRVNKLSSSKNKKGKAALIGALTSAAYDHIKENQ